jgi:hypothetical protein
VKPPARIRIVFDYSPLNLAAMEWTTQLAHRLQAEMDARFIEDLELFQIAQLPFTRHSGGEFNPEVLALEMVKQASQLEQQLRELATKQEIPMHFSRVRGRVLEEIRRACEDVSLLVLQGFQPSRPRLGEQAVPRMGETVMVVFDGSKVAIHALTIALQSIPPQSLHVLIQADDREQAREKIAQLELLLGQNDVGKVRTSFLPLHDGDHLIHLARLEQPAAIFLPHNNALLADHPMRELISALPCPLAIVGSGG